MEQKRALIRQIPSARMQDLQLRFILLRSIVIFHFFQLIVARYPQDVDQAIAEYPSRRDDLIEAYVRLTDTEHLQWQTCKYVYVSRGRGEMQCTNHTHIFGSFRVHGSQHSFRRMTAWLIAYKKHFLGTGDYNGDVISWPVDLHKTPAMVEEWMKGVKKYARSGTDNGNGNGDYDMGKFLLRIFLLYTVGMYILTLMQI